MSALARTSDEIFMPLRVEDIDAIMPIENDIYPFPWTRGNFTDSLQAGYSAWLLRRDGSGDGRSDAELIAYAVVMIALDEAHLLNLSVARQWQRRGYGWRMLEWMAGVAREHGARTMLLEVRPSNAAALRMYKRYGFDRIGVRRDYYPAAGGREDAVVMRIAL